MKRLIKRLTIRRRAYKRGADIRGQFGFGFFGTPAENNACRSLIRLHRIRCGLPPFAPNKTGWLKDVFISDIALKAYGNIRHA